MPTYPTAPDHSCRSNQIIDLILYQSIKRSGLAPHFGRTPNIIRTNLLTKFHEDRKINVASRVLTRKNALPLTVNVASRVNKGQNCHKTSPPARQPASPPARQPASPPARIRQSNNHHFFQANIIIFKLIQDIIETNLLNKFHEDWTINVASRVLTRFYYSHIHNVDGRNHHDWKINVTFGVLTRKIAPPPWWPYIIGINLLTQFHEDRNINVASRVKNAPPLGGQTNLLTIFHQDWTINVASRVLTRFYYSHIWKNAPPPGGHVFQPTSIIFEHVQDIIGMNLLTKFHEDWTINMTSRVLTRIYYSHIYSHIRKNAPPLGSHVFQAKVTIFEFVQNISGTNLMSKFHEDRKINVASRVLTRKNALPPGGHVFQPTGIIFELVQDIIGMNLLTNFYEDQTITVASRVKNAPPLGSLVFQANVTIFEIIQDIIKNHIF
ncbi:hypothetical protein DPMN_181619 [Dreissena polymorpha]|uniref:Uncharacterized protein n=1 Tax=Dreissena polymorpha TaxID=45954 RepID=A0A9D4DDW6_DREPO|nr:hypothetical protein DPMN_181619 [Dreissena polymorpha]